MNEWRGARPSDVVKLILGATLSFSPWIFGSRPAGNRRTPFAAASSLPLAMAAVGAVGPWQKRPAPNSGPSGPCPAPAAANRTPMTRFGKSARSGIWGGRFRWQGE